ncbi:MAG TPA: DEAD/DEAH box helicase [Sulfurimonas sp.]|nr:DEAD/DEAH box helicase [Sulfurimonas sp.]
MKFTDLGLNEHILRAINDQGYDTPTPVQEKAIPLILEGKDVLAGAQTGTGKTAGFTLPMLNLLANSPKPRGKRPVRGLILTPTRELAAQVAENVRDYGKYLPFKSMVIFGGVSINPQINNLKTGVDIIIATPGRLLDLMNQRAVDLTQVEFFVLDEADRMLDMGFIHDIKKILKVLPKTRQNLLFSATFSKEIKTLASGFLNDPSFVEVARTNETAAKVEQIVYPVDKGRKREMLTQLIRDNNWEQVLVFTRTKHMANRLAEQLDKDGISSSAIHGNKSQNARTKALAGFKAGKVKVLVATDIAARGIDIDQLSHVVNYELPNIAEDYVHRIGRTGRAGNSGQAVSLVCVDEHDYLRGIESLIKTRISQVQITGFTPDPSIKAEAIQNGRGGKRGGGGGGRGGNGGGGGNRNNARSGRSNEQRNRGQNSNGNSTRTPKPRGQRSRHSD